MTAGEELRLAGSSFSGRSLPRGFEGHEILVTPIRSGGVVYGALAASVGGGSWAAWPQLTRSVAQRIAQLCVHERMRREQEEVAENARHQAALMTALIQNAPDIIAHLNCDGIIQFANRGVRHVPASKLIGASLIDFARPSERERLRGLLRNVIETGEPTTYEIEGGTTESPSCWSCRMGPVRENGGVVGVVLVCRDISEQRAIEARLRVSDRLAAIGTLAAGVAHEINTPIQYVANNLDFVVACVKALANPDPPARGMTREFALERLPTALADCEDGVKRVAAITHAMRTFSHPGTRYDQVDLNDGLQATVELTRHEWKESADVEIALDPDLPSIVGSRAELNQVFLNLVINGGHAIQDAQASGGDRGKIRVTSRLDGDSHVVVEVADNGCGIPLAAQARVYDLFFTTKEVGRGSGQGLALAHSVITAHGGTIRFETAERMGTTFILRLPIDGPGPEELS